MRDCEVGPDNPASVTPTPMIEMLLFDDDAMKGKIVECAGDVRDGTNSGMMKAYKYIDSFSSFSPLHLIQKLHHLVSSLFGAQRPGTATVDNLSGNSSIIFYHIYLVLERCAAIYITGISPSCTIIQERSSSSLNDGWFVTRGVERWHQHRTKKAA